MATRYFKNGVTTWNTANNWSATSASGADNAGVPTAADDVIFELLSGSCQIDVNAVCRSIDTTSGVSSYGGTITYSTTAITLTIGDATAGAGSVALKLNSGVTYTAATTNTMTFVSTSTTLQTVTTASKSMPNLTFNGAGGKWQFADGFTNVSQIMTLVTGTLDMNGQTFSLSQFSMTGSATRTITFGAANITLALASSSAFNGGSSAGATVTANTATITFTGAGSGANCGSTNWNGLTVVFNGSGIATWSSNGTIKNITRTGTAVVGDTFIVPSSCTITGALTVTGQSLTNRVLFSSNVVGTQITLTDNGTAPTLTNVDFKDMKSAGTAGTWSGTSMGDCGGNSGITFTGSVSRFAVVAGNLSSTATWSSTTGGAGGSSVPLPQDNVFFDAGSAAGTYTQDMPRMGTNFDFTNFTRTFSMGTTAWETYGSLTLVSGMTLSGSPTLTFAGRSSYTITSNTKVMTNSLKINAPSGTYTLADNLTTSATSGINVTLGTFVDAGFTVALTAVGGNAVVAGGTATLTGTWNFSTTTAITFWTFSGGVLTATAATIVLIAASTNTRTFAGGGGSYGTLTYNVAASPGILAITGANTFSTLTVGSARVLTMPSSTTNTITTFNALGVNNGFETLPGVVANYVSTPDAAANSVTGNITFDVKVALNNWNPGTAQMLMSKTPLAGNQAYDFWVDSAGKLNLRVSADGTNASLSANAFVSTVATGLANGAVKWVRVSLTLNNGSNSVGQFFMSDDGSTWTQLGTNVTKVTIASIFDSTGALEVGSNAIGVSNLASGNFYEAKLYNSAVGSGSATAVFDANFATKAFGVNTFTESSSNAATVTLNGVLAQAGDGRVLLNSSIAATTATMTTAAIQSVDYLTIRDSTVDVTPKWYAGGNSVNTNSTAVNWIFTVPPLVLPASNMLLMGV